MNILITAGNTQVFIDRVRYLTNSFTGRTGAQIASHAASRGHHVKILTSHPERLSEAETLIIQKYQTFDELNDALDVELTSGEYDVLIHCAAVSDYLGGGIYAPEAGTSFRADDRTWQARSGAPKLADRTAGKVKSDEPELWLRLVRAPKLIDRVRSDWRFPGILVKFKLEVGIDEKTLRAVAEESRLRSDAELMVANRLETVKESALIGPLAGEYHPVTRDELPKRLIDAVERIHEEKRNG